MQRTRSGFFLFEALVVSALVIAWWLGMVQLQAALARQAQRSYHELRMIAVGRSSLAQLQSGIRSASSVVWQEDGCSLVLMALAVQQGIRWYRLVVSRSDYSLDFYVGLPV